MGVKAYAIADLHLGHPGIIEYRNFATMEEHDDYVVAKINEVVNPTDYLYILGDVVITPVGYKALAKINCQNLILVPGNHDGERAPIHYPAYVRTIGAYTRRLLPKHREVVFTHIPVHPLTLDRWSFNIHGHLHTDTVPDYRYFCASCEQLDYKPIEMQTLRRLLEERLGMHRHDVVPVPASSPLSAKITKVISVETVSSKE